MNKRIIKKQSLISRFISIFIIFVISFFSSTTINAEDVPYSPSSDYCAGYVSRRLINEGT